MVETRDKSDQIAPDTQKCDEEAEEETLAEVEPISNPVTELKKMDESVTHPIDECIAKVTRTNGDLACNAGNAETDIMSAEAPDVIAQVTHSMHVASEADADALPEPSDQNGTTHPKKAASRVTKKRPRGKRIVSPALRGCVSTHSMHSESGFDANALGVGKRRRVGTLAVSEENLPRKRGRLKRVPSAIEAREPQSGDKDLQRRDESVAEKLAEQVEITSARSTKKKTLKKCVSDGRTPGVPDPVVGRHGRRQKQEDTSAPEHRTTKCMENESEGKHVIDAPTLTQIHSESGIVDGPEACPSTSGPHSDNNSLNRPDAGVGKEVLEQVVFSSAGSTAKMRVKKCSSELGTPKAPYSIERKCGRSKKKEDASVHEQRMTRRMENASEGEDAIDAPMIAHDSIEDRTVDGEEACPSTTGAQSGDKRRRRPDAIIANDLAEQVEISSVESTAKTPSNMCVSEGSAPTIPDAGVQKRRCRQKQADASVPEQRLTRQRENASKGKYVVKAPMLTRNVGEACKVDGPEARPTRQAYALAQDKITHLQAESIVSDDEPMSNDDLAPSTPKRKRRKSTMLSKSKVSSSHDAASATISSIPRRSGTSTWTLGDVDVDRINNTNSNSLSRRFWDLIRKYDCKEPPMTCGEIAKSVMSDIEPARMVRNRIQLSEKESLKEMIKAVSMFMRRNDPSLEVGSCDVLSGNQNAKHTGNVRFQSIVIEYMKEVPMISASQLVELVKRDTRPGRFLSDFGFGWCLSTDKQVYNKIASIHKRHAQRKGPNGNNLDEFPQASDHVLQAATLVGANNQEEMSQASDHVPQAATLASANNELATIRAARQAFEATRQKLAMNDSADLHAAYAEDVAWRMYAMDDSNVDDLPTLPPPEPLPSLISEESCIWSFDKESRILKATLKPDIKALSLKAKEFLLSMMERDDIAVVIGGLCRGLEQSLWNNQGIISTSGDMYHHRFRRFVRIDVKEKIDGEMKPQIQYEEIDKDLSMKVCDYFKYLEEREKVIEYDVEKQGAEPQLQYVDFMGEVTTLDLDQVIYMLDYDIKRKLPLHYENFKDTFSFPEILPGGKMCAMNAVNEAARPDMGPNLYVTPPGSFTRFHQDGYGTVDSGHLCLSGYNEVVMLRRLPNGHDSNAIRADCKGFFEMPHSDLLGRKTSDWPTKAEIERMKSLNYCPIVLILGPGEHLHIGKGRFHAFRKLGAETLADDDCHSDLRKEVHLKLRRENISVGALVNFSIAWDWSFLGLTPEGINREMASTLEFALRNRKLYKPKQSLAIPKLCLLSCCKSSIAAIGKVGSTFGIQVDTTPNTVALQRHRNILKGLLPALEFVVSQEQDGFLKSRSQLQSEVRPHSWENSVTFPLDPYGNSDYFCKICFQELSNTYMHCNGCEDLLKKDFNVCAECHSDKRHRRFVITSDKDSFVDSSLNHTGGFTESNRQCGFCNVNERCGSCLGGRRCCCTCHTVFTLQQRMWNCETLSEVLTAARAIVDGDKVRFFDEVLPRLQEARLSKDAHQVRFLGRSSKSIYYLDISPEALASTAPFNGVELPALAASEFDINLSPPQIREVMTTVRNSRDLSVEVDIEQDVALQLFRNFNDGEDMVSSSDDKFPFSRRELDIIAFALMQARNEVSCPFPPVYGGKGIYGHWGYAAWNLMPYRSARGVVTKFYTGHVVKLVNNFRIALENGEYVTHLQERISPLFESAALALEPNEEESVSPLFESAALALEPNEEESVSPPFESAALALEPNEEESVSPPFESAALALELNEEESVPSSTLYL